MTFFNLIFVFLFSLVSISLFSSEQPIRPIRSTQESRDGSPAVQVRANEDNIGESDEEYETVIHYEYPGCRDVSMLRIRRENRRSLPIPNTNVSSFPSRSLPNESKLAQITALTSNQNLSQSTERFNMLRDEIAGLKELLLKLVIQQSRGNPENPS